MKNTYDIEHLNECGEIELRQFERLVPEVQASAEQPVIRYSARGESRPRLGGSPQIWLHLSAQVALPMMCQRCLTTVETAIAIEREFRFVATEEQALLEDEESEEDILVQNPDSSAFNLRELLEDELIMALPMVAMHEECTPPVPLAEEKINPFAVLGQLKK